MEEAIRYLTGLAKKFEQTRRYPKTTKEILNIVANMKNGTPSHPEDTFNSVLELIEEEFVNESFEGRDYRKKCFEEITKLVFAAMGRMGTDFHRAFSVLPHFASKMEDVNVFMLPIKRHKLELLEQGSLTVERKIILFHLDAYIYLVLFEGMFDELARILYFLKVVSKDYVPELSVLMAINIDNILHELRRLREPRPFFLQNWKEKKYWRHAIAHATAYYDPGANTVHLVAYDQKQVRTNYNEVVTIFDFHRGYQELESTIAAYDLVIRLVGILSAVSKAYVSERRKKDCPLDS